MIELTVNGQKLPLGKLRMKTRRTGGAGMVTAFTPDLGVPLALGSRVRLSRGGEGVFAGYLFCLEENGDGRVLTAYDQLRYLLYRDTKVFSGKTAGEIVREICGERGLALGEAAGSYRIPSLIADNRPLLDIIRTAIERTAAATGERLCFYDGCGTLQLKPESAMALPLKIDGGGLLCSYSLTADIGRDSYNRVQIVRKNRKSGRRDIFVREDRESIARWGTLQYCAQAAANATDGEIAARMEALLQQKNRALEALTLQCAGDLRFQAGRIAGVSLPGREGRWRIEEAEHLLSDGAAEMKLKLTQH